VVGLVWLVVSKSLVYFLIFLFMLFALLLACSERERLIVVVKGGVDGGGVRCAWVVFVRVEFVGVQLEECEM